MLKDIDKAKLLYWLQVASAALGGIVSAYNLSAIINRKYTNDPRFFRSKAAYRIYIASVLLLIAVVFLYLKLKEETAKENQNLIK